MFMLLMLELMEMVLLLLRVVFLLLAGCVDRSEQTIE